MRGVCAVYYVTCPKCGTQFDENLKKCPNCHEKNRKAVCRTCGAQISASAKSCVHCGAKRRPKMTPAKTIALVLLVTLVAIIEIAIFASPSEESTSHDNPTVESKYTSPIDSNSNEEIQEKSPEDVRAEYIATCSTFPYEDVSRNPDKYKGQSCAVKGTVIQVAESVIDLFDTNSVTLRIEAADGIWYVDYTREEGESRILEGDEVICYGECDGVTTYIAIMGNTVTVPKLNLKYYELLG